MIRVGILLIRKKGCYLNGRFVADGCSELINYAYIHGLPTWLVVFVQKQAWASTKTHQLPCRGAVWYRQFYPFVYVPDSPWGYARSVLLGMGISVAWVFHGFFSIPSPVMPEPAQAMSESAIYGWVNRVCKPRGCVQRVSLYPNQIWFKLDQPFPLLAGCTPVTTSVIRCQ